MSGKDLSQYLVEGDIGRGLTPAGTQELIKQQNTLDEFDLSHLGLDGVTVEGGVDAALDDTSCPSGACKI